MYNNPDVTRDDVNNAAVTILLIALSGVLCFYIGYGIGGDDMAKELGFTRSEAKWVKNP